MLTHIDLFSGVGGFALAARWAGFRTVVFCEIDEFCQKVLEKRFDSFIANPSIWGLQKQRLRLENKQSSKSPKRNGKIPIIPDIRDFDGTEWQGATLLTGGFPCQPFSVAGQRRGKKDNRYLWPEMFRVIKEAKPHWVLGENVAGIVNMALDQVLADLEGEGYETGTIIIPACAINAPHRRDRVWIIAHSRAIRQAKHEVETARAEQSNKNAPDSERILLQGCQPGQEQKQPWGSNWDIPWIEVATRFCRVDDGVSNRVDRLKALGNAIVPQCAFPIFQAIAQIEREKELGGAT